MSILTPRGSERRRRGWASTLDPGGLYKHALFRFGGVWIQALNVPLIAILEITKEIRKIGFTN